MKTLPDYMKQWSLSDPSLIEKTKMCEVYRVTDADGCICALKIMNDIGLKFEGDSYEWFQFIDGKGAAQIYDYDENAILLEYCGGGELAALVDEGYDDQANNIAAHVIKDMHEGQKSKSRPPFKSMMDHYICLFETPLDHPIIKPAQDMTRYLIETTRDEDICVLHADIHHKNILKSDRGWLAIDPQKAIGDRHYEVANMFKNPIGYDGCFESMRHERQAEIFVDVLGLDKTRILQFAFSYMALSAAWHKLDEEEFETTLKIGEMLYERVKS